MTPVDNQPSGMGLGRSLILIILASAAIFVIYNFFKNQPAFDPEYTNIPEEMQITYQPSDFKFELDEEDALAILANPHRYRREFNELVDNFNLSLLHHVATRMGVEKDMMGKVDAEYGKHQNYIQQLYFDEFVRLRDTSANLHQAWYENEQTSAVKVLNEVGGKYTCFLVNLVMTTVLEATDGKFFAKGKKVDTPCGIAMTEGLRPMIERLQNRAAINDFSRSRGLIEEKVESVIAELATIEIRDKKALSKQLQTKVWGFNISSTDIEISAISILKIGFKLDRSFSIALDEKSKKVQVNLPQPIVLSHEVFPKVDKLDVGWLREVQNADFNQNFNILREEFRRDAINEEVLERSRDQARNLMDMLFTPVISSLNQRYELEVQFVGDAPRKEEFKG
jgi:hypothetical protein